MKRKDIVWDGVTNEYEGYIDNGTLQVLEGRHSLHEGKRKRKQIGEGDRNVVIEQKRKRN